MLCDLWAGLVFVETSFLVIRGLAGPGAGPGLLTSQWGGAVQPPSIPLQSTAFVDRVGGSGRLWTLHSGEHPHLSWLGAAAC